MEEKNSTAEVVDTAVDTAAGKTAPRSFRCISEPMDKRIIAISFLTAVIAVVLYHFTIIAINHFGSTEEEPVYCHCHRIASDDEAKEEKGKEFRRGPKDFKGRKGGFFQKMSPEMREKIRNMSPEERREFFAKLRQKHGKEFPGRPQRPQRPQAHPHHGNHAEQPVQE